MITYKTNSYGLTIPVLHKVKFAWSNENVTEIRRWCKQYCKAGYYFGPAFNKNFCEFEDDEDAMLFALRWS